MANHYTVTHERESCPTHGHASSECTESCELVLETYEIEGLVSPYVEARISGPPENCYPAEGGEVEFESVDLITETGRVPVKDWEKHLTTKEIEEIEQRLFDAMMDDDGYDYEPYDDCDDDF
jgi:hypothetical protein